MGAQHGSCCCCCRCCCRRHWGAATRRPWLPPWWMTRCRRRSHPARPPARPPSPPPPLPLPPLECSHEGALAAALTEDPLLAHQTTVTGRFLAEHEEKLLSNTTGLQTMFLAGSPTPSGVRVVTSTVVRTQRYDGCTRCCCRRRGGLMRTASDPGRQGCSPRPQYSLSRPTPRQGAPTPTPQQTTITPRLTACPHPHPTAPLLQVRLAV